MTLRSPVFRKLFLSEILLVLLTLVCVDFLLTRYTAARETEHVEHELAIGARTLAGQLPSVKPAELHSWVRHAQELTHARVTIIDQKGTVLADSRHDPETMENHAQRPEVRQAMRREHVRDIVSVPFALLWQITLFLLPMQAMVRSWHEFQVTLAVFLLCSAGMYWFWYRNLPPRVITLASVSPRRDRSSAVVQVPDPVSPDHMSEPTP